MTRPISSAIRSAVIHGDEPLLVAEAQDAYRNAATAAGYTNREVYIAESGFDWGQVRHADHARSLFSQRKLIELRIPSGKPGQSGADALMALCAHPDPDRLWLITLPRLDKATQNSKWFQTLAQTMQMHPIRPVERASLPAWLLARLRLQHQSIDAATGAFFADQVEGNLLAADQALQKFALLYPEGPLSFEVVREVVTDAARFDIFQLALAALHGDAVRFVRMLHRLRDEGIAQTLALWALNEDIHLVYRVKQGVAQGETQAALFQRLRIWGAKQNAIRDAAQRLDGTALRNLILAAAATDQQCKGIGEGDPWLAIEQLGLQITGLYTADHLL